MHLQSPEEIPTRIPPTRNSIKFSILRSHLVTLVWKSSHEVEPYAPVLEHFGWKLNNNRYEPIMTDQLPAPAQVIELSICVVVNLIVITSDVDA